ncbi:34568_t:CDS:1, partial [Racocetra persica]
MQIMDHTSKLLLIGELTKRSTEFEILDFQVLNFKRVILFK